MAEDLYSILGVSRTASAADLKKAYRRLARENHPDVRPNDKQAEDRFKKVTAAFEVLGDERKRKLYDEFGEDAEKIGYDEERAAQLRRYKSAAGSGGMGGGMPFEGGGDFDLGDLFAEMFGRRSGGRAGGSPFGGRASPSRSAGEDFTTQVTVTLRDAVIGGERVITLQRPDQSEPQRLTVKIPPGVTTGSKIRLAGQGGAGYKGGPAGDLYMEVEVSPHHLVRREGEDLYLDLPITVPEALLGAEVRVPTFDGDVTVTIPKGSQSGRKLRLKGRGVPALKGGARGDFYLVLSIQVPKHADSPEVRAAANTLGQAYGEDVRAGVGL